MTTGKIRGRVIRQKWIMREDVSNQENVAFVFGDNMVHEGFGGQAASMRGCHNAIGVPTKWAPGSGPRDYFTDADLLSPFVHAAIAAAFHQIGLLLDSGVDVVIPADGLGTGLSELPQRAPKIYTWIEDLISGLETES